MMKRLLLLSFIVIHFSAISQNQVLQLDTTLFKGGQTIWLADTGNWVFKKGSDISWADPKINTTDWDTLRPSQIKTEMADESGRLEGWFRIRLKLDSTFTGMDLGMIQRVWAATDIFIDGEHVHSFGNTGMFGGDYKSYDRNVRKPTPLALRVNEEHTLAIHFVDEVFPLYGELKSFNTINGFFNLVGPNYETNIFRSKAQNNVWQALVVSASAMLTILFWLIYFVVVNLY